MEITGKFWQEVIRRPLWLIFKHFGTLSVYGLENLEGLKGPLIIAANHKDYIDGFLIGAVLPRGSPLIPLRYMVIDIYFQNPISWIALKLLGTYPAYVKQGLQKSLAEPMRILKEGGVVAIFPEGKRIAEKGLAPARPGVAILAFETDAPIVPVAIRGGGKMRFTDFFKYRYHLGIIFGRPFKLRERVKAETSMNEAAQAVMDEIQKLYNRIPELEALKRHPKRAQITQ